MKKKHFARRKNERKRESNLTETDQWNKSILLEGKKQRNKETKRFHGNRPMK